LSSGGGGAGGPGSLTVVLGSGGGGAGCVWAEAAPAAVASQIANALVAAKRARPTLPAMDPPTKKGPPEGGPQYCSQSLVRAPTAPICCIAFAKPGLASIAIAPLTEARRAIELA